MSLLRQSRTMALGTVASRATGFARTAALAAVLGVGATTQSYTVANTVPNVLYELLLGGVLTSTVVPLLVRARREDADGGQAYAQRLLSLLLLVLGVATVAAVLAAPLLVDLYLQDPTPAERSLAVAWARFFLPQVLFYGLSAVLAALLNARGRFAAPMWAPVLNNVVVLATLGVFWLVPGPRAPGPDAVSPAQLVVLGVGTTLGIAVMTAALLPSLHATGFRWRLRLDLRGMGLRRTGRLAAWVLLYVGVSQVGYVVMARLATEVDDLPDYTFAFVLWQLPHAVVAVSVITALLPRMSDAAAAGDLPRVRRDLDAGLRLATLLLLPAAVGLAVLGTDVATVVYAHGATSVGEAQRVGLVLAVFAVGLLPFSVYQMQSRAFYALQDTRTPALLQVGVVAVLVTVDLTLAAVLDDDVRVYGLAAGHAAAYVTGVCLSVLLLRRRVGRAGAGVASTVLRVAGAATAGGLAALGTRALLPRGGTVDAVVALAVAGAVGAVVVVVAGLLLRVPEAQRAVRAVLPRRR